MIITTTVVDASGNTISVNNEIDISTNEYERRSALFGDYLNWSQKPIDGLVGCYPGVERSNISSLTLQPNGYYENLNVAGDLNLPSNTDVNAPPAVLRNVKITGSINAPTSSTGLIRAWGNNHFPIHLVDCEIAPTHPNQYRNGIMGHSYTLERVDISNVVDGFMIFNTSNPAGNSRVKILGCRVRDHYYVYPAAGQNDGSHCDGGQILGMSGTQIYGSWFSNFVGSDYSPTFYETNHGNAGLMIKPDSGLISGLDIQGNWFDGGAFPINIANDAPDRILTNVGTISRNQFGKNARRVGYSISMPAGVTCITDGNIWKDDGTAVLVRRNG